MSIKLFCVRAWRMNIFTFLSVRSFSSHLFFNETSNIIMHSGAVIMTLRAIISYRLRFFFLSQFDKTLICFLLLYTVVSSLVLCLSHGEFFFLVCSNTQRRLFRNMYFLFLTKIATVHFGVVSHSSCQSKQITVHASCLMILCMSTWEYQCSVHPCNCTHTWEYVVCVCVCDCVRLNMCEWRCLWARSGEAGWDKSR